MAMSRKTLEMAASWCAVPADGPILLEDPIHQWFSLSYAHYLVLPRSILQSMHLDFQRRLVALLDELEQATADRGIPERPMRYRVTAMDPKGRFVKDPYGHYDRGRRNVFREETA